jgi:hypothetical protein
LGFRIEHRKQQEPSIARPVQRGLVLLAGEERLLIRGAIGWLDEKVGLPDPA